MVQYRYGDFGRGGRQARRGSCGARTFRAWAEGAARAQGAGDDPGGLATAAGISVAHLSRLESGERQPSLDGLLRLAFGLGVPFDELFEESEETGPGTVVRGAEAPFYESWALRFQPLMPEAGPEGLTAVRVVFPADRVDTGHHDHEHGGQEWLYMLKGRLRLTLGDERTVLEPGDAAFFEPGCGIASTYSPR